MKSGTIITPKRPTLYTKESFGYLIKLNKSQVDYRSLKTKKDLKDFGEKTNRHITIIGGETSTEIKKVLSKLSFLERKKEVIKIEAILKKLRWQYVQKEIYFVNKRGYFGNRKALEHRESYIRMIDMTDIDIFYRKLNKILKTKIPTQVPHITLFVNKGKLNPNFMGIPIPSKVEFKKLNPKKIKL